MAASLKLRLPVLACTLMLFRLGVWKSSSSAQNSNADAARHSSAAVCSVDDLEQNGSNSNSSSSSITVPQRYVRAFGKKAAARWAATLEWRRTEGIEQVSFKQLPSV